MPLLYQYDGTRSHTALLNLSVFASHGKVKQVSLTAQSPDLNVDDLAFSRSLQFDVSLDFKQNRRDLLNATEESWKAYPSEEMNSVWSCLHSMESWKAVETTNTLVIADLERQLMMMTTPSFSTSPGK